MWHALRTALLLSGSAAHVHDNGATTVSLGLHAGPFQNGMSGECPSLHLLQTTMSARRAPEVPGSQLQQDTEIRRSDLQLRLENSQLKGALERSILQLSVTLRGRRSSFSLHGVDFGEPLPMTLLVTAILLCIYGLIYLVHLVAFFGRRNRIKASNRRRRHVEAPERLPDLSECKEEMTARFCCNTTHKTVVRLFLIVIVATAGGSFLLREGYFDSVKEKLVPLLYLAIVVLMILQVIIAEAWTRIGSLLEPLWRFHGRMKDVGNSGFGVLSKVGQSFGSVPEAAQ
mmetsp:Transcript_93561/g.222412  ORF Transcript_93561/g.222412 Transcript_93561/m.222412 type:complete len:286 (+) Transcript_93561:100-957(+)